MNSGLEETKMMSGWQKLWDEKETFVPTDVSKKVYRALLLSEMHLLRKLSMPTLLKLHMGCLLGMSSSVIAEAKGHFWNWKN